MNPTTTTAPPRVRARLQGALCLLLAAAGAPAVADEAKELRLGPGWVVVGTQHVRDGAERDLAVLDADRPLMEIRVCARDNAVRLRNATAWLPGDRRQKLWLPLVLDAGKCSAPIKVQRAPRRVTHIAFEYEAVSAGWAGARLVVAGRPGVHRP
jgi:hypothetical protein